MRKKDLVFLLLFCSCMAFGQVEQFDIQLDNKVYVDGISLQWDPTNFPSRSVHWELMSSIFLSMIWSWRPAI